ncbi:hypothetical protein JZ751_005750 [Albula glossodonta]|uniref:Uncharacterized protein n=1 Tax=Albula glossodonta TaxID=121402 RepID=A0A8T2N4Y7_9TELE|nr:hypothetical protein JZ751_005750 [Albula glossodonta]
MVMKCDHGFLRVFKVHGNRASLSGRRRCGLIYEVPQFRFLHHSTWGLDRLLIRLVWLRRGDGGP